jgi:hypothetical protein
MQGSLFVQVRVCLYLHVVVITGAMLVVENRRKAENLLLQEFLVIYSSNKEVCIGAYM